MILTSVIWKPMSFKHLQHQFFKNRCSKDNFNIILDVVNTYTTSVFRLPMLMFLKNLTLSLSHETYSLSQPLVSLDWNVLGHCMSSPSLALSPKTKTRSHEQFCLGLSSSTPSLSLLLCFIFLILGAFSSNRSEYFSLCLLLNEF